MLHRLSKSDRDERNLKIAKMLRAGSSYEDIARRYGLSYGSMSNLAGELGARARSGPEDWDRACFVDGIN